MDKVPRPRKIKRPHRYLSKAEINRLWAVCDDRPLFLLLISGLRASEAVGLRWEDVEGDVAWIRGKGDRYRRIVLPEAFEAIPQGSGPVLGYDYYRLRRKVRRWGRAAKVPGMRAHLFRHSWATHALMEGMDMITLQNQGGWADTAMITHYAQSAVEDAAILRARALGLAGRLLE
jgi:integrase/recombinase XerD